MSETVLPPTAPTTLVILLGASAWPNSPGFQASRAFVHAAQGFRDYLLDPHSFGLTTANLLDQFDAQTSSSEQLELLGFFLEQRMQALKTANQAARDVLVYFVGHGGFAGPSADFYLLLRRTNASSLRASGMAIDALAEVLREKARQLRRYLFLDCCFAAAAFRAFQGGPDQTAITKTLDAFAVQARSSGFPRRGTVLLCSSDQKSPSLLLPDESCTMFSYALLDVLKNGDLHRPRQLSLRDLKELAEDRLATLPEKNAPRPGLHSPDQSEGDVADIPFFPNPYVERERARLAEGERRHQAEQERLVEEEKRRRLEEERTREAEEEQARQTEEEKRHQAEEERQRRSRRVEQAERARLAMETHVQDIAKQTSPMQNQMFSQANAPHTAIPPERRTTLPLPLIPRQPKRRRSPAVIVVLILLVLILLGGGSFGIYGAATGNWPWSQNISRRQSTPVSSNTSVPGMMWHAQNSSTSNSLEGVAWSGSQFVAVGWSGTILTSPDGRTWTAQHFSGSENLLLNGVAKFGTQLVAVGSIGTILTSPDGHTWTAQDSGTRWGLYGIARSSTQFVAVGFDGTILTSPDGRTWTASIVPPGIFYVGIARSSTQFVAVGSSGTILTSPDGHTWTTQHSGTSKFLRAVVWSDAQFVAVGEQGTILTSPDGHTWTTQHSGTSKFLRAVVRSDAQFVTVGDNGTILTSPDGHTWTAQDSGTSHHLLGVAWSGSQFVIVGTSGTILTSL